MPLVLVLIGAMVIAFLSWGSIRTLVRESADDLRATASGGIVSIQERAGELTQPVIEQVDTLDRRVDAVQKGVEKLREGADLLRQGVAGE